MCNKLSQQLSTRERLLSSTFSSLIFFLFLFFFPSFSSFSFQFCMDQPYVQPIEVKCNRFMLLLVYSTSPPSSYSSIALLPLVFFLLLLFPSTTTIPSS